MRTFHASVWPAILLTAMSAVFLTVTDLHAQPAALEATWATPIDIVKAYLRATKARDSQTAYRHISAIDKGVRTEKAYIRSQETFDGFALELAKRLADDMEVWVIEQRLSSARARLEVGYRMPTGDELSPQVYDWNPDKLNGLSAGEQTALFAAWKKIKRSGTAVTIEGRERFDLVKESDGWKIFLDWRSRSRIAFKTTRPAPVELDVKFRRDDLLVNSETPFQVDFKVSNRTDRAIVVQFSHRFEPRHFEKAIDMIACGSLLPISLRPRETREISSSYLLRRNFPAGAQLVLVYGVELAPATEKQMRSQSKVAKST
jgi:hypothetical protein